VIGDWPPAVALIAMIKTLVAEERLQSRREEIANSVSSGIGLIAIIGGIPFLLGSAIQHGSEFRLAGVIIFAATMVSLYLSSTIYHALPRTKIKRLFRLFDHWAIFLLIAGTYTPFALGALRGVWGWTLFSLVWCLAILGIGFKALGGLQYRWLSTCLYVGMGWMAVFAIRSFGSIYPWKDCSGSQPEGSPTPRESCSTSPGGPDTATSSRHLFVAAGSLRQRRAPRDKLPLLFVESDRGCTPDRS
jgi:hemolysin III